MHRTEADLSADERHREITAILAAGILRLSAHPGAAPEPTSCDAEDAPEHRLESTQKPLDSGRASSPPVLAG